LTPTVTPTGTLTPSDTPTGTLTPSNTPTHTGTPTNTLTPTNTGTPTNTATPTCEMHVWPNPFSPKLAYNGVVNFGCLPDNAMVNIYTLSGELCQQVNEMRGMATWNGTNKNGSPVATGVYFYVVLSGDQVLARGKILVTNSS